MFPVPAFILWYLLGSCGIFETKADPGSPTSEDRAVRPPRPCPSDTEKILSYREYDEIFLMNDMRESPVRHLELTLTSKVFKSSDIFLPYLVRNCKGQLCLNVATVMSRGSVVEEDVMCVPDR